MIYHIWTNGKRFKLQRKSIFGWVWLDECNSWNNWYGRKNPRYFYSLDAVLTYCNDIEGWKLITADNIDECEKEAETGIIGI